MAEPKLPSPESELPQELLQRPLRFYIKQNWRNFSLGLFFLFITNGMDALYPMVLKIGIDQVVAKAPPKDIFQTSLMFFVILAILAGTRYAWRTFFAAYHTDSAEDLRRRVFAHLTKMNPRFFQKNPTGELMSLLMNDIQAFRNGIGSSILILVDGIMLCSFLIPFMIYLNPDWTWKTMVFLPFVPLLIKKITASLYGNFKIQQERTADWSGYAQESVAGVKVLKSFSLENIRTKAHNTLSGKVEEAANRTARVDSLFSPIMTFGASTGSVILLFIAGPDVLSGAATVGTLVAFQRYISKLTWPMTALGYGTSQYQKGMASFERIKSVLLENSEIADDGLLEIVEFKSLEVKNLCFSYETQPVLEGVSFQLKCGQTLGIVGSVGSGKSTLLHLLCRFYEKSQGEILLNGQPIEKFSLTSLRNTMNLVTQEPFLFSDSIEQNLFPLGLQTDKPETKKLPTEELLREVDLWDEVSGLPSSAQSQLGERGVNLSGGQKQRLSLARGMARNSTSGQTLLLLDDVLSAVDSKTEKKLIESLSKGQQTRIIVSHKISALKNCDGILVLNQGKMLDFGLHSELLERCPFYRNLVHLQSEESVAP